MGVVRKLGEVGRWAGYAWVGGREERLLPQGHSGCNDDLKDALFVVERWVGGWVGWRKCIGKSRLAG